MQIYIVQASHIVEGFSPSISTSRCPTKPLPPVTRHFNPFVMLNPRIPGVPDTEPRGFIILANSFLLRTVRPVLLCLGMETIWMNSDALLLTGGTRTSSASVVREIQQPSPSPDPMPWLQPQPQLQPQPWLGRAPWSHLIHCWLNFSALNYFALFSPFLLLRPSEFRISVPIFWDIWSVCCALWLQDCVFGGLGGMQKSVLLSQKNQPILEQCFLVLNTI